MFEESPDKTVTEQRPADPIDALSEALERVQNRPLLQKIEKNTSVLPALLKALTSATISKARAAIHGNVRTNPITERLRDARGRYVAASAAVEPAPVSSPAKSRASAPQRARAAKAVEVKAAAPAVVRAMQPQTAPAPGEPRPTAPAIPVTLPPQRRTQPAAVAGGTRSAVTRTATPAIVERVRERNGRFRSAGQIERERQQQAQQSKGLKGFLKAALSAVLAKGKEKEGDIEDAAGKAIGGPIYEAAKEMQGAFGELKEKLQDDKTLLGKSAKWLSQKLGKSTPDAERPEGATTEAAEVEAASQEATTAAVEQTEEANKRRHRELLHAIEGEGGGGGGRGGESGGGVAEAVGGSAAGALAFKYLKKIPGVGKVGSLLGRMAPLLGALTAGTALAGMTAIFSVGSALKSLFLGGSNPINDLYEKVAPKVSTSPNTGTLDRQNVANTERVNAERVRQGKQPLKYDPVTGAVIPSVVHAVPGATTTVDSSGNLVKRTGDRNWRNHNPGNLEYGDYAKSMGATGTDGRFAVFPDYQTGRKAMAHKLFKSEDYSGRKLSSAIAKWAPPGENDTASYQKAVLEAVGGKDVPMSRYSSAEQQKILDAMQRKEGFRAGRTEVVGAVEPKQTKVVPAKAEQRELAQPRPLERVAPPPVTATLEGADKLVAALSKPQFPQKRRESAGHSAVKVHYDDTMLNLMAHDRL